MTADEWVDPVPFARARPYEPATHEAPCGASFYTADDATGHELLCDQCAGVTEQQPDDDVRAAAEEIHDGGRFCDRCEGWREIVDEFDDQLGVEEQAREVRVTALDCGHEQVVPIRRRWPWSP